MRGNSTFIFFIVGSALASVLAVVAPARSQPVSRSTDFSQPAITLAHEPNVLQLGSRPRVALIRSTQTIELLPESESFVSEAVYQWEIFLLGLQIPYVVLEDAALSRSISKDYRILILPGSESLSPKQRDKIIDFVKEGGGLIASGRPGYYDERGRRRGNAFLSQLLGQELVEAVPRQKFGLLQSIEGDSPVTDGIPAGFQLNIAAQSALSVIRPDSSHAIGWATPFEAIDREVFKQSSLLHIADFGKGGIFWARFLPHEVSKEVRQQANYQRLIVNALSHLSRSKSVSVGMWKFGYDMALSVVALPSPGFDAMSYLTNYDRFIDALDRHRIAATFFFASDEITAFPDLYRKVIENGSEIGLSADNDSLLIGQPRNRQYDRLSGALESLQLNAAHGVYPPGGFLDGQTVRVLDRLGAAYVLRRDEPGFAPDILNWWSYVDYDDSFVERSAPASRGDWSNPGEDDRLPTIATIPFAEVEPDGMVPMYERIQRTHGHYVLPLHVEQSPTYSKAYNSVESLLSRAKSDKTWIATVSEVLIWSRIRANIKPRIVYSGPDEMQLEVENFTSGSIYDAYLIVRFPEGLPENLTVNDTSVILHPTPEKNELRVELQSLASGRMNLTLFWDP